jgi:hypothetical protein
MKTIVALLISFFSLFVSTADAQIKKLYLEAGISANSYKGSLNEGFGNYSSSANLGIRFCKNNRLNGRINLSYGVIEGQSISFVVKNASGNIVYPVNYFKTSLFTFDYTLNFNVIAKKRYLIYLGAGVGIIRFNVMDNEGNNLINNANTRDIEENYRSIALSMPVFIGYNYIFKNDYRVGLQAQLLNPFTDYLDNTSKWSPYVTSDNVLFLKFFVSVPISLSNAP